MKRSHEPITRARTQLTLAAAAVLTTAATAQNLYEAPPLLPDGQKDQSRAFGQSGGVQNLSLFFVRPPDPRVIKQHDIIEILISESSSTTAEQTLETEKSMQTLARLNEFVDVWKLLELQLRAGNLDDLTILDADAEREYEGEGEYERTDRFSARIAATVLEVKPNGTLVVEARKRIVRDEEVQELVLSGRVRQEDVTEGNTVLSSQIAELTIAMHNEGEVRKAAKKGLITRVLDSFFSF